MFAALLSDARGRLTAQIPLKPPSPPSQMIDKLYQTIKYFSLK